MCREFPSSGPICRYCNPWYAARPYCSEPMAKRTPQLGRPAAIPAAPDQAVLDRVRNPRADTNYLARFSIWRTIGITSAARRSARSTISATAFSRASPILGLPSAAPRASGRQGLRGAPADERALLLRQRVHNLKIELTGTPFCPAWHQCLSRGCTRRARRSVSPHASSRSRSLMTVAEYHLVRWRDLPATYASSAQAHQRGICRPRSLLGVIRPRTRLCDDERHAVDHQARNEMLCAVGVNRRYPRYWRRYPAARQYKRGLRIK